jgi:hypothetical protein
MDGTAGILTDPTVLDGKQGIDLDLKSPTLLNTIHLYWLTLTLFTESARANVHDDSHREQRVYICHGSVEVESIVESRPLVNRLSTCLYY